MEEYKLNDTLKELEESIFNNLKVASLGIYKSDTTNGIRVRLIPQIEGKQIVVETLNKIKDIQFGDIVCVLFLDNFTKNFDENNNIKKDISKHNYNNCVVLCKIER